MNFLEIQRNEIITYPNIEIRFWVDSLSRENLPFETMVGL